MGDGSRLLDPTLLRCSPCHFPVPVVSLLDVPIPFELPVVLLDVPMSLETLASGLLAAPASGPGALYARWRAEPPSA